MALHTLETKLVEAKEEMEFSGIKHEELSIEIESLEK